MLFADSGGPPPTRFLSQSMLWQVESPTSPSYSVKQSTQQSVWWSDTGNTTKGESGIGLKWMTDMYTMKGLNRLPKLCG